MPDALTPTPAGAPPPPYDRLPDTAGADVLSRIEARLTRIEASETKRAASDAERAGAVKTLTTMWAIFGGLITAGAIALGGWVWSIQGDVGDLVHETQRNAERLEEHRRQGGPMGHPESVIARTATNEGRITANADGIRRVEGRLDGIEDKLDEVLERLPRRTR